MNAVMLIERRDTTSISEIVTVGWILQRPEHDQNTPDCLPVVLRLSLYAVSLKLVERDSMITFSSPQTFPLVLLSTNPLERLVFRFVLSRSLLRLRAVGK